MLSSSSGVRDGDADMSAEVVISAGEISEDDDAAGGANTGIATVGMDGGTITTGGGIAGGLDDCSNNGCASWLTSACPA